MKASLTTTDGRALAYETRGSGPILVCHPGGPGFSGHYFADVGGLDEHVTLVSLDPRGAGSSDPPSDGSYRLEEYAADLEELRRHLGREQVDLLGHSHGGFVGMTYAALHPERVRRLVLVGTLARFSDEQRAESRALLDLKATQPEFADAVEARRRRESGSRLPENELRALYELELRLYFLAWGGREQRQVELILAGRFHEPALRFFNETIASRYDQRPHLARITAPTLVVAGDGDYVARPLCAQEIGAAIAGSRVVILEDAGHFPWVEQPERMRTEVASFLAA